jgi:hypothetical protein
MLQQEQKNKELREILSRNVPSYNSDRLTKELCEDVLEIFGSLYPGQALSLCMKIAQRVELHQNIKPPVRKKRFEKSLVTKRKEKSTQSSMQRKAKAH